jgi:hypothetical protein
MVAARTATARTARATVPHRVAAGKRANNSSSLRPAARGGRAPGLRSRARAGSRSSPAKPGSPRSSDRAPDLRGRPLEPGKSPNQYRHEPSAAEAHPRHTSAPPIPSMNHVGSADQNPIGGGASGQPGCAGNVRAAAILSHSQSGPSKQVSPSGFPPATPRRSSTYDLGALVVGGMSSRTGEAVVSCSVLGVHDDDRVVRVPCCSTTSGSSLGRIAIVLPSSTNPMRSSLKVPIVPGQSRRLGGVASAFPASSCRSWRPGCAGRGTRFPPSLRP